MASIIEHYPDIDQLQIRPLTVQDLPQLLTLLETVEVADQDGNVINLQTLLAQADLPGFKRWGVDSPDGSSALIASAILKLSQDPGIVEANISVHPGWRRHGIGSALLSRILERSAALNVHTVRVFSSNKHPHVSGFLQKHGFIARGAYTEMRFVENIQIPPVIWPFGYSMRPYSEVKDISILTQAMNLSYIPLWGHQDVSEAQMASWLPEFNQDGLFLVFSEKGRVIGISRVEPSEERTIKNGIPTGYIDAPGIVPQHRRLDLYRALVLTGIKWLRAQGQTLVEMESWGDKLEVLKMSRELGFTDIRQLVQYELSLP